MTFGDNNGYGNGNFNYGSGYYYNGTPQQQQPKQTNFLSQADVERLMKKQNQFSLALSEEDKLRAYCNHRKPDGSGDALVENPDGTYSCQICGYTFKPLDAQETTHETLQNAVNEINDVLQTIKLIFIDMDPSVAKEYFQIIPLIEKVPSLFDIAVKDYSKHETYNPYGYGKRNLNTAEMFNSLVGLYSNPQQYQQPQQMGGFQQQPQYGNQYQNPYSNGFGAYGGNPQQYQQPQNNGYHPQTGGFAYGYDPSQYTAQPQQQNPQAAQQPNVAAPVNNAQKTAAPTGTTTAPTADPKATK